MVKRYWRCGYNLDYKGEDNNGNAVFESDLPKLPFFVYQQPYNKSELTKRTYAPKFPFKIEQLSAESKKKALYVPVKFKDTPAIQLAEFLLVNFYSGYCGKETIEYKGRYYDYLPTMDGKGAYFLLDQQKEDGDKPIRLDETLIPTENLEGK